MLQSEFEARTGFKLTTTEYAVIKDMYRASNRSREQFCKDFKENGGVRKLREEMSARVKALENENAKLKETIALIVRICE